MGDKPAWTREQKKHARPVRTTVSQRTLQAQLRDAYARIGELVVERDEARAELAKLKATTIGDLRFEA